MDGVGDQRLRAGQHASRYLRYRQSKIDGDAHKGAAPRSGLLGHAVFGIDGDLKIDFFYLLHGLSEQ